MLPPNKFYLHLATLQTKGGFGHKSGLTTSVEFENVLVIWIKFVINIKTKCTYGHMGAIYILSFFKIFNAA